MAYPALAELEGLFPLLYGANEADRKRGALRRDELFGDLARFMATSDAPPETTMKFGTSGWRGLLASDFTIPNVACVTQALVDTLQNPAHHRALGVTDVDNLRRRGCVLAHDTRIMGPEFTDTAASILLAHDIRALVIG